MGACHAAQYLVVTHGADGTSSFQAVEAISVNGKDKIRAVALPSGPAPAWDSKAICHQAEHHFSDFSTIRRAPDGTLLARDAGECAAELATGPSLHKLPGVTDADAFHQQVSLLPQAAKAFSTGPAADRIRAYLNRGVTERLKRWREGDVEVTVLDEASALSEAAAASFQDDATLAKLRAEVQSSRKSLDRRVAILKMLDAGRQSDAFLLAYRDFEIYDQSFPALIKARLDHLERSTAAHLETAKELQRKGDYSGAIRHLLIAKWRNPKLAGADQLLEHIRLEAAQLSAQK